MTLEEIETALDDAEAEQRRVAIAALEEFSGDDRAGPLLLKALGDSDWRVRQEAIRVGTAVRSNLVVGPLVEAIAQGDNVGLRNAALELLGEIGATALDALVGALPRVDEGARKFVIEALARGGDARAATMLVPLLDDADPMVVTAATEALAVVGGTEAEAALMAKLRHAEGLQRMAALDALDRLEVRIEHDLLRSLVDDRLVRRLALSALGRTGDPRAASLLSRGLADSSRHVTQVAAEALSRLRRAPGATVAVEQACAGAPSEVRDKLEDLARHGAAGGRRAAVELLALARDERVLHLLLEPGPRGALDAAGFEALTAWGVEAAGVLMGQLERMQAPEPTLLELVSDLLAAVRSRDGASARLERHAEPLRKLLRGSIHSPDPDLAAVAARCLAEWAEADDASRLASLAVRSQPHLAAICADALERLAAVEHDVVSEAILGVNLDSSGGAQLTSLVATLAGEAALERLHTALLARDPETRCAAIHGIARIGGVRAAELIAFSLTDESPEVQAVAADALGTVRDAEGRSVGVEPLLIALDGENADVRAAAARALGTAGESRAIEPLRRHVRGESASVSIAALEALRRLDPGSLDDLLVDMLAHQDREVVKQVLKGLAESTDPRAVTRLAIGLAHGDWAVRRLAATLLSERGDDEALQALQERAPLESDELVCAVIDEALAKLGAR